MAARLRFEAPTDTGEQRLCARGIWCSASTRDVEGNWHPARTWQAFCSADQSLITEKANLLPAAYVRLAAQIGQPARRGKAVRVPPGSRVLLNADIDALLRLIADGTAAWAARTRAIPGLQLARPDHAHASPEAVAADCAVIVKHTGPMLALPPGPMTRIWTWPPGSPMPPDVDKQTDVAALDAVHGGDGWVKAWTTRSGEDAGTEILDLHSRAVRLLGETPAPVTLLDGIPCRSCEAMSSLTVLEQPQQEPGEGPPPFCRCVECRDEMDRHEYDAWVRQYAAWVEGSGILTCRRCELGLCAESPKACQWDRCTCNHPRHAARAA
jgi:hypothetical protein